MELTCLRHGLTIENVKGIYHGTLHGELTDDQRVALASIRFDASYYDAIYCSPSARCRDTARALGITSSITEIRISERNFGIFEGLTRSECEKRFPEEFQKFQQFDAHYQIPQGESRTQNLARVLDWLQEACRFERVLAVTHGGTIDFLYRMAGGLDHHGGTEIFSASNASLSVFRIQWPSVVLIAYDRRLVA